MSFVSRFLDRARQPPVARLRVEDALETTTRQDPDASHDRDISTSWIGSDYTGLGCPRSDRADLLASPNTAGFIVESYGPGDARVLGPARTAHGFPDEDTPATTRIGIPSLFSEAALIEVDGQAQEARGRRIERYRGIGTFERGLMRKVRGLVERIRGGAR